MAEHGPSPAEEAARAALAAVNRLLAEVDSLREENRSGYAALDQAVADSARRAEALARQASEGVRVELGAAVQRLQAELAEVKRTAGVVEGGVGESRAALVELVEYDRQRRRREDEDRAKAEKEQRAAKAKDLNRAARGHHRAGRREEAIAAFQEARSLDPENAEILSNLGAALLSAGRVEPAEEPLRRALRLDDGFAPARANLGAMLLLKGESEEALKQLEAAAKLDPNLAAGWNSLGNARWIRGNYAGALEAWLQAYRADPLVLEAARNLQRQQEIE